MDIATYRAEFLAHYYETQRRPLEAYAFGLIDKWAALGSVTPRLANVLMKAPGVDTLVKRVLHLAPQREMPQLAPKSFTQVGAIDARAALPGETSAGGTARGHALGRHVQQLFPPGDEPRGTGRAAGGGSARDGSGRPPVLRTPACTTSACSTARRSYLQSVMDHLGAQIDAGVPLVVLEPSCASVFRDELRNLFPSDARADRLRQQTFLLSEFLERHAPEFKPPRLERSVLLHGHCHHKALMKMTDEESVLRKMGAQRERTDAGCCGMAGPFGFDAGKFDVSMAIGERVLLPAVRSAPTDTLIVSDGFSCREQIRQATGRTALHVAEAIQLALPVER